MLSQDYSTRVVYLFSSSTSHNSQSIEDAFTKLYISSLLQQATTIEEPNNDTIRLYISSLLQQATTGQPSVAQHVRLYISSLLQQATTYPGARSASRGCISLLFFNKPQQYTRCPKDFGQLYISSLLQQATTFRLYIAYI